MLDIKDVTDVVADVVIYQPPKIGEKTLPPFVVQVPAVTRHQVDELTKACQAINATAGFLTEKEQEERFNAEHARRAPNLFIKGWRGLTLEALAYLGIVLGAAPEDLDAEGCVPYTPPTAQQLWVKAYPERFQRVIALRARSVLEAEKLAERARGNG